MKDVNSKGFRDLIAWQKGMELSEMVYKITISFPKEELYGITSQMRRAAVSIPSNIAEGQLRNSKKEFIQFLSIALGSCAELSTQLELSKRLRYLTESDFELISELIYEVMKILHGLRKKHQLDLSNTTI
jgi:four helix bundle protein